MPSMRLGWVLVVSVSLVTMSSRALGAQRSRAMSFDCRNALPNTAANRQHADQWVQEKLRAFVPAPDEALRMRALEQGEQVKLAIVGISSTCQQYLAGTMEKDAADLQLSAQEEVISNFLHDLGNDAVILAARAQVSDMENIRHSLTEMGGVARQAALLGEDKLADESWKKMVDVLTTFSKAFVGQTCWNQVFDDELPFALQRQNDLLNSGIDLRPCAQRRFNAQVSVWTFESCTVRGVGEWRVLWNMSAPGTTGGRGSGELEADRDRAKGKYKVDWGANGVEYRASGKMELARHDNGAGKQASYVLSGDMETKLTKGKEKIAMLEKLMGRETKPTKGDFSVDARVSEKPCRSLDE